MSAVSMVLDHCHISPVTPPSGSTTSPVIVLPTCGAIVRGSSPAHRFTVPGSSTLVTVTVTACMTLSVVPSLASTVTMYTLSVSMSAGASKFGDSLKVSIPSSLISKSSASSPDSDQVTVTPSGSVPV